MRLAWWLAAALVLWGGCAPREPAALKPVPAPDTSAFEPSVRKALAQAQAQFERIAAGKPGQAQLGEAYGELGMSYQAQALVDPAEAAYADARALAPGDARWPYLQGHLYNDASRVPEAIQAFEAALAIAPSDAAIELSLAQVYLQDGKLDQAQALYERLQSDDKARAAALAGLGKVALAKRQYREAIEHFEEALKLWPSASVLRRPLATAYQALGDQAKAEENLARFSPDGQEPSVDDPVGDILRSRVAPSSRVLMSRGKRAAEAQRLDIAEAAFRAAVEADPKNAEAVANLGITLANLGRTDEAQRMLAQSVSMDASDAIAQFSLGAVYDRQGRDALAIKQYEIALARDPGNSAARVYLADAKLRLGLAAQAAALYRRALEHSPDDPRVRYNLAMAELKQRHYAEARRVLEDALKAQPDNFGLINALARLLASAPDASVRNGPRSLAMAKALYEATHNADVEQTYAMALAETADYAQATTIQREAIEAFERLGASAMKPVLERNLALYQHGKPVREGWAPQDVAFQPRASELTPTGAAPPT